MPPTPNNRLDALKAPLDVLRSFPPHDHTLGGVFDSRCALRALSPMLVDAQGRAVSWADCARDADALARALFAREVRAGDRVAIVARNGPCHVLLLLALARLGAILVPINPEYGVEELGFALRHADVSGVFVDEAAAAALDAALPHTGLQPWIERADDAGPSRADVGYRRLVASAPALALPPRPDADAPCVMIFTSGTTGYPKGVMHSQRSLTLIGEANLGRMMLQPDDRILVVLPFFHVNALCYSLCGMLASGSALVLVPRFSASGFWRVAADTGATVVNLIETLATILKSRDRDEFRQDHRLRVVYGVRQNAQAVFRDEFGVPNLLSGFGMSEVPGVTCNPYGEPARPGSMGLLAKHPDPEQPWAACRIVDERRNDVAAGVVGELWVRTPVCMLGYFRDPAQTRSAFDDGWFRTGDLVTRDADGWFHYVSRAKDIIRRRGENIAGAELDRVIGAHPSVLEAAAIAVPSELGEDEILAVVAPHPGAPLDAADVAEWCRQRLAPHKVPRYVAIVEALPHTPTHKIAKARLREDAGLRARAVDLQAR